MHRHYLAELLVYLLCVGLLLGWGCVELVLILHEIDLIHLRRGYKWYRVRRLLIEGEVARRLLLLGDEVLG